MHVFSKTYECFEDNICIRTDTTLSYLDVSISICQGKFITEVFDKWDNFNFHIVNYPYMCSNNYTY